MKNDKITILTDTREQKPLSFSDEVANQVATLHTGDYSLLGYESSVAFERKSVDDLVGTLISGYEADTRKPLQRFNRTLLRLQRYDLKAIVIECQPIDIDLKHYRSLARPSSVWGMLHGIWATYGVPFVFTGTRQKSAEFIEQMCRHYVTARTKKWFLPVEKISDGEF